MSNRSKRVKNGYRGEILLSILGLSNDQAAELLGVSYQSISNWITRRSMPQRHIDRLGEVVNMAMMRAEQVRKLHDLNGSEFATQFTIPDPTPEDVPGWYDMPLEVGERVSDIANVLAMCGRQARPLALRHVERTMGMSRIDEALNAVADAVADLDRVKARHEKALQVLRHEIKAAKLD